MSKLLCVSVPDDLLSQAEAVALAQGKTKSQVVREALRRHVLLERLRDIQAYGQVEAGRKGIGPEDAEGLVDQVRRARG